MQELAQIIVNNGTAVGCLLYFMWFTNNTMKEFTNEMKTLNENIQQAILEKKTQE